MADQVRAQGFVQSLRDWGYVFMLAVWLQSIMASAIAKKTAGTSGKEYLKRRNDLMKEEMATTWKKFMRELPGSITMQEELAADMIILVRNQLAHCFISSGREFALFLPKPSSLRLLDKLTSAGWVEPPDGATNPEVLIMREGDTKWFNRNTAMILNFLEHTILRLTRVHGIDDSEIC